MDARCQWIRASSHQVDLRAGFLCSFDAHKLRDSPISGSIVTCDDNILLCDPKRLALQARIPVLLHLRGSDELRPPTK